MPKMAHFSMDRTSTNWAVLHLLQRNQEENVYSELVNIVTCSLYILCGALNAGKDASSWHFYKI